MCLHIAVICAFPPCYHPVSRYSKEPARYISGRTSASGTPRRWRPWTGHSARNHRARGTAEFPSPLYLTYIPLVVGDGRKAALPHNKIIGEPEGEWIEVTLRKREKEPDTGTTTGPALIPAIGRRVYPATPRWSFAAVVLASLLSASCLSMGRDKVVSSHTAYNDSVQLTVAREVLTNIVRTRYADTMQFITVQAIPQLVPPVGGR